MVVWTRECAEAAAVLIWRGGSRDRHADGGGDRICLLLLPLELSPDAGGPPPLGARPHLTRSQSHSTSHV